MRRSPAKILVMDLATATREGRVWRLVLVMLGAAVICGAQTEAARELILPSGKLIRVLGVSRLNSTQGTALVLKYQTDVNISDVRTLRKEIDEVWPVFQGDVDKAKLTTAIIAASGVPQGVVLKSAAVHYFMFRKIEGDWRLVSDTERRADRATR